MTDKRNTCGAAIVPSNVNAIQWNLLVLNSAVLAQPSLLCYVHIYTRRVSERELIMAGQQKTILIVDDDRDMGEMLKNVIHEQTSHRAVWISESDLVLEAARYLHPSLILLDYMMPIMDGLKLYDYLQEIENMHGVPVILISGSPTLPFEQLRERGIHTLRKPFELNDLLDLIAQLMTD